MPKRKRGTEMPGTPLVQEPCARPPLRKSARLLERESHQSLPLQKGKRQREEKEQCTVLPSSSATGSTREDVCPSLLSEINSETSTDDTTFENQPAKTPSAPKTHSASLGPGAGHKRKREETLGQAGVESRKQTRESEPAVASPNLKPKEQLNVSGDDDDLSKKQKLRSEETVPTTNIPAIESPEKPAKEPEVREAGKQERHDPISYWAAHHTWPKNFAEHNPMVSSMSTNKRQRMECSQSGQSERPQSYAQSRKHGEVPEQYTAAYQEYILTKGLDMDYVKGGRLVSEESKKMCNDLKQITHPTIEPNISSTGDIETVVKFFQNRNEAIVTREITPMIIPSIPSLYFGGDNSFAHVVDELNADWYDRCVLAGPRLRPDLAIGLFSSAFTQGENKKLSMYAAADNWTQTTAQMFFPFLMCEVKCGEQSLDIADRQNMHSCSVAVRAICRIQQAADQCRPEKKTDSLDGKILVFSISHDQEDARLYGHFAIAQGQTWTYHRHRILKFDLTNSDHLLAIHNFNRNLLKSYLPVHVQRLKDALEALPDPNIPSDWSRLSGFGRSGLSGLSAPTSAIQLSEDGSQQDIQNQTAGGIVMGPPPSSSRRTSGKKREQENFDKLFEELRRGKEEAEARRKEEAEAREKDREMFMEQIKKLVEENSRLAGARGRDGQSIAATS